VDHHLRHDIPQISTVHPELADRGRIAGAQAEVVTDEAPGTCRTQAGTGALRGQRPLDLGDNAQHVQREHALRCAGVDRDGKAAEYISLVSI